MMLDTGPAIPRKLPGEERFLAARRPTGFGEYMGAMSGEGWWNTIAGQGRAQVLMQEGREADPTPLARDAWEGSSWKRDGLDWFEGLTEGQAKARAEVFDENAYRRWVIQQRNAGVVGSVAGFGAMLAGSLPTPENLIPIGPAIHAARAARFGVAVRQGAVAGGVAGLAGTAAFAPPVYYSAMQFGDDITFADVLLDLSVGTILGAGLGGGSAALARWADRAPSQPAVTQPEMQAALDGLAMGAQDMAAGRSPDVAMNPAVQEAMWTARAREEAASARVTTKRPQTLTSFLRSLGGLVDDAGELRSRDMLTLRPGMISRRGRTLDDATLAAWEAGFLAPRNGQRPTPDDLLRAIDEELAGRPVFSANDTGQALDFERQRQAATDFDDMQFRREDARSRADAAGYQFTPEQIDEALTRAYGDEGQGRDLEDIFDDMAEAEAMRFADEYDPDGRTIDEVGIPFEPFGEDFGQPEGGARGLRGSDTATLERPAAARAGAWASRNPADPDLEPVQPMPKQADGAEAFGIDAIDQATADRLVAELEERGLIPDEIRAELEEAMALEAQSVKATEAHERAAACVIGTLV